MRRHTVFQAGLWFLLGILDLPIVAKVQPDMYMTMAVDSLLLFASVLLYLIMRSSLKKQTSPAVIWSVGVSALALGTVCAFSIQGFYRWQYPNIVTFRSGANILMDSAWVLAHASIVWYITRKSISAETSSVTEP